MLPWYIYIHYGDLNVLEKHWSGMNKLMEHYKEISTDWIINKVYGDWFDPGAENICEHTPSALTSTFWFFRCAKTMISISKILDLNEKAENYVDWTLNIKNSIIKNFFDQKNESFRSQTANSMAIYFGIMHEGQKSNILNALVEDIEARNNHLNTGIMGVRYLFEVLTQHGFGKLAIKILHQNTYPSFGDLIRQGATTTWEYWGEKEHDEKHGARSLNHPMMSGYDNWFYNTLAGIQPDLNEPGFKHFFLVPNPIVGIKWLRCNHLCLYGKIESNWNMNDNIFEWEIKIPEGTKATIKLPFSKKTEILKTGNYIKKEKGHNI